MARAGELLGLAYIALQPGQGYSADVLGSITNDRLLAIGICHELVELIAR